MASKKTVQTIVSADGTKFRLEKYLLIEKTSDGTAYFALRPAIAKALSRLSRGANDVSAQYSIEGSPRLVIDAEVHLGDKESIHIGCQVFRGKNADKLRSWAS